MIPRKFKTQALLERWHDGDRHALEVLLERELPWIEGRVRDLLGFPLRQKAETSDFVQDVVLNVLAYEPRFRPANRDHFHALLDKIIRNTLRDRYDHFTAHKRSLARERPLPSDDLLSVDPPRGTVMRPSEIAELSEWRRLLHEGMASLGPADRRIVLLRESEGLSYKELGRTLCVSEDAARMRFARALLRLTEAVRRLQDEQLRARASTR